MPPEPVPATREAPIRRFLQWSRPPFGARQSWTRRPPRTSLPFISRKARAITGRADIDSYYNWVGVRIGEPTKIHGATFEFDYSLHTIPTIRFRLRFQGKSMSYSADTKVCVTCDGEYKYKKESERRCTKHKKYNVQKNKFANKQTITEDEFNEKKKKLESKSDKKKKSKKSKKKASSSESEEQSENDSDDANSSEQSSDEKSKKKKKKDKKKDKKKKSKIESEDESEEEAINNSVTNIENIIDDRKNAKLEKN